MDQEGGRRRSTRLAARGVASPIAESPVVKKAVKSTEKPKRAKRKPTEDVVDLPDSKKSKSEENSSDETDKPEENKTNNIEKIEEVDEPAIPSIKKDSQDEDDIPRVTGVIVRKNTDESIPDSKTQDDNISDADDKKEVVEDSEESANEEKQQPETQEPEVAEQQKNDVSQEKPDLVAVENNGDDKKTAESVKAIIVNNDNGFCVAAKDLVTSNGDTDAQINTANGEKETPKPEAVEPIKVLHDNTNHVAENDLKSVTSATVNTTSNNDVSGVEQVEKEQDKVIDNANDEIIVSTNDSAPNVDQPSTIVS